jgi:hypothetical protein
MLINDVIDKLKSILDSLTGTGQPLVSVFDWANPDPQEFPCLLIGIADGGVKEKRLDSADNEFEATFAIELLMKQELTRDSYRQRNDILNQVLAALRTYENYDTLDGTVEKMDVADFRMFHANGADAPRVGFDLYVRIVKIEPLG